MVIKMRRHRRQMLLDTHRRRANVWHPEYWLVEEMRDGSYASLQDDNQKTKALDYASLQDDKQIQRHGSYASLQDDKQKTKALAYASLQDDKQKTKALDYASLQDDKQDTKTRILRFASG
jgi:hypothetical protein